MSETTTTPIFDVSVPVPALVHDLPAGAIRAAFGGREPHILPGRDVLNAHRLVLDGPNLILELD